MNDPERDKNCFEELSSINPVDWINIPEPLQNIIILIKECFIKTQESISTTNHNIYLSQSGTNKKFEIFETTTNYLKTMIITSDENSKSRIQEAQESLSADIAIFKKNMTKDLDFKQKSNDKRISLMEEQSFMVKKTMQAMMGPQEIEDKINNSAKETRESVKTEIKDFLITPEVRILTGKIDALTEAFERNKRDSVDKIDKCFKFAKESEGICNLRNQKSEQQFAEIYEQKAKDMDVVQASLKRLNEELESLQAKVQNRFPTIERIVEETYKRCRDIDTRVVALKDNVEKVRASHSGLVEEIKVKDLQKEERKASKLQLALENEKNSLNKEKSSETKQMAEKAMKEPIKIAAPEIAEVSPKKEFEKVAQHEKTNDLKEPLQKLEVIESKDSPVRQEEKPTDIKNISKEDITDIPTKINIVKAKKSKKSLKKTKAQKPNEEKPEPAASLMPFTPDKSPKPSLSPLFSNFEYNKITPAAEPPPPGLEDRLTKMILDSISPLQTALRSSKIELEISIKDIKEKLSWFPMSLTEIKNKPANEARLYTLEARLRQEENSRVEQFNQILYLINQLRAEAANSNLPATAPNLPQIARASKSPEKRASIDGVPNDYALNLSESDIKGNSGGLTDGSKTRSRKQTVERRLTIDFELPKRHSNYFRRVSLENNVT